MKAQAPGGLHWIVAASGLERLAAATSWSYVRDRFDNANTFVVEGERPSAVTAGWRVNIVVDARSLSEVQAAVAARRHYVLFDIERWRFTPRAEQLAPAKAIEQAVAIARGGARLIVAPALDLALDAAGNGSLTARFLHLGVLQAAAHAWGVDVQAQGLEGTPSRYVGFVEHVNASLRSTNPRVVVFAGISTNPSGQTVLPGALVADIASTRTVLAGYWLNIPSSGAACPRCGVAQPQVAVDVLRSLSSQPSQAVPGEPREW